MVGAAGERLFEAFRVGYLATVRNDGAPRVHPVSVTFHESGLYVFVIAGSPRLRDLLETGHFALHSYSQEPASGSRDDEQVMVAGRALPVREAPTRAAVASAHATKVQPDDVLFELRIDRAAHRRREQGSPVDIAWAARGRLGDAD